MHINLPNILTWLRIVAIPGVVVLFFYGRAEPLHWFDPATGLLFAAAAITDSLDGYLARRMSLTTPLGAFLDPVADKLMVTAALVLIVSRDPQWPLVVAAIIIIGREIAVSALREWMAEMGQRARVAVSAIGKYKTILQMVGLSLLLYRHRLFGLPLYDIGFWLTLFAALLTFYSMLVYLRAAMPVLMPRE
jgi:CDP-diacylglycerol--glycerol-3-phosphate 3-phosphatidyltransferase/cardiolipin synthase